MDTSRFAVIARSVSDIPSRRDVLHGLVVAGLGLAASSTWSREESAVAAKKKRKKKKKKKKPLSQPDQQAPPLPQPQPPFNAFGCLDVGQSCQGDSALCCSGICDPGTSTCIAHNAGICFADTDTCTLGQNYPCHPDKSTCFCSLTTGNAGFCGDFSFGATALCRYCSSDTDCQEELGPGAACVVLKGVCSFYCADTDRTACVVPCA